jgi:metal-responsive CopG/Arc/MetJ family transcriptional regulator
MHRPSDTKVSIRIPKALLDQLDATVKREPYQRNRRAGCGTRSSLVRRALDYYLNHRYC